MIKLKNILFVLTFLFIASLCYAAGNDDVKNFISVNTAGGKASGNGSLNTISVGQTVVATEETKDTIFRAGFLSAVKAPQSSSITFTNLTEQKTFETNVVPVKIQVVTSTGNITKLLYRIAEGENGKFGKYEDVKITNSSPTINFEQEIPFDSSQNQHRIQFYAQYEVKSTGEYSNRESNEFTIWTQVISSTTFKIISPDAVMGTAALDPLIETTALPIDLVSTVTISLTDTQKVEVSTTVLVEKGFIDTATCNLKCNYSDLATISGEDISNSLPANLSVNKQYTLKISLSGKNIENGEEPSDEVTFKVIGTGVADIYIYPSPFKPKQQNTTINFILAYDSNVTINLYDKAGKIVCRLIKSEHYKAGINKVEWDGRNYAGETLAVGAYICEIIAKSTTGNGEHRRYTALAIGK